MIEKHLADRRRTADVELHARQGVNFGFERGDALLHLACSGVERGGVDAHSGQFHRCQDRNERQLDIFQQRLHSGCPHFAVQRIIQP